MQIFLLFALLIALVAVIFAVQNTALVTVSFLLWDIENSLAVILLVAVFAGVLISLFASLPGWVKNRLVVTNYRKKVKELDANLAKQSDKTLAALQELELYKARPETTPEPLLPSQTPSPNSSSPAKTIGMLSNSLDDK